MTPNLYRFIVERQKFCGVPLLTAIYFRMRAQLLLVVYFIFSFTLLLTACGGEQVNSAALVGENGIVIAPQFAAVYDELGGRRTFADPITDAFQVEASAPLIQYFQNMRLEYDATQSPGEQVTIYPLGEWAFEGVANAVPAAVPENSRERYFPETGLAVQDEFLNFYETYSGQRLLGPPISPQLDESGLRVQYFTNGRLEWRPELPVAQRIQVSHLGQAHFDAEMAFIYRQTVLARPVPSAGLTNVEVSASVKSPVLYGGEEQVLYVTVLTQAGRPVAGIDVDVTIVHDGTSRVANLGVTDSEGKIQAVLNLTDVPSGQEVELRVAAYASGNETVGTTTLTFQTWW